MAVDATHVVTGEVRMSYVTLDQPRSIEGGEPKYSVTILIPKSDAATKQRIDAAIELAKQKGLTSMFGGKIPNILATPLHDGDGYRPSDGEPYSEECKGHWVMAVSNKNKPAVVDANRNPIINASELYSGMYGRVSMDFFPYASNKKGIGVSLGNVQKLRDGDPLTSRTTADQDFGDEFDF